MSAALSLHDVVAIRVTPIHEGVSGRCWRDIEITSLSADGLREERTTICLYADNKAQLMLAFAEGHPHA